MKTGTRVRFLFAVAFGIAVACGPTVTYAQSALDGFNPGANNFVYALAAQRDGKILVGGAFTMLGGGGSGTTPRSRIGRLNADGSIDTLFNPGANSSGVFALMEQPDGKILVGGVFTTLGGGTRNRIGRLNANGLLDTFFDPGADNVIRTFAVQPNGQILVGGDFTMLGGGGTGTIPRNKIGRLNADGSIDDVFNPGANGNVHGIALQPDGKILVVGEFTMLGGGTGTTPRSRIGRLNADGSLDSSFDAGANLVVLTVAVEPDGQILVGGAFTLLGGDGGTEMLARERIGRLDADGSVDASFDPGASNSVSALAVQPDGKILVSGHFSTLGGLTRNHIGQLEADGSLATSFNPGADGVVYALAVQPDGKIAVGGTFTMLGGGATGTTARSRIGRLTANGWLDADLNPGPNSVVDSIAVQPDGKILFAGSFSSLGPLGLARIGRLNGDGSVDTAFNPGANNAGVRAVAVQPDGKIVVGGYFTMLGGGGTGTTARSRIGRLTASGALDGFFDPGANDAVLALAVQPDGKIVVGGHFTKLGGGGTGVTSRSHIGRLNADGSVDESFDPGASSSVFAIALQPDGKILIGGVFIEVGGGGTGTVNIPRIARLNPDGSLDTLFAPGANDNVYAIALQPDGKILAAGPFTTMGDGGTTPRRHIARLNADGSLDNAFNPGADSPVTVLAVQTDGKILAGGPFRKLGGVTGTTPRERIGRLHPDGLVDASFDPGADNTVYAITVQPDGKVLVGGNFAMLGGGGTGTTARNRIGRLTNTDAAIERLSVAKGGRVVTWTRSGAGPEVWGVTFESSTDATTYASLGAAARVPGGWQLTGQSLPASQNLFIRARGYHYGSGLDGSSGSIVESVRNAFVSQSPVPFTDEPLIPGVTLIRAVHITELRMRIDNLRAHFGLPAFPYADPALSIGATIVRAQHVADLRAALLQAYAAAGWPSPIFTDMTLSAGVMIVKALHVTELRTAVEAIE